jgi:O-glycosyl hydrolase
MRLWRRSFRRGIVPLVSGLLVAPTLAPAGPAAATAAQQITLDGATSGRVYDGIGALSAGASSRLLVDYPEPQRGQILDYLFKPGYGAALQILKVEIGGDTNSTDGAEPSHQRTPTDRNCDRGYEWWLLDEAKKRNPNIKLSALQWGAPHWTGNWSPELPRPTVWTDANIDYLINWLDCARQRGHRIDYLGGWNEAFFDTAWYPRLRAALDRSGYRNVLVVADDSFNWDVVRPLTEDPAFNAAVDVVGQHYICGYLGDAFQCPSPPEAQRLGKPLHASEQGSLPYDSGAVPLTRAYNRPYIDGAITSTVNWSLIASWYDTMPFQGAGLMGAVEPWSGAYNAGASIWATAHTTQFTRPGWRYLDSAKGRLSGGGSHVALRGGGGEYSTVVETIDATEPQEVTFQVTGGLSDRPVSIWSTNLTGPPGEWFVRDGQARPDDDGRYTVTLLPGRVYSLTTTTGQGKGQAVSPPARPLPLPYQENFERYGNGRTPRFISDLDGAFETARCAGRDGRCLRQVITEQPVWWNGWLRSWRDYETSVDAMLERSGGQDGHVELLGRVDGQFANAVSGIHLRVSASGDWRLYEENLRGQTTDLCVPSNPACAPSQGPLAPVKPGARQVAPKQPPPVEQRTLATGRVPGVAAGEWHRLGLGFSGNRITASLDGRQIAAVDSPVHASGQVGMAVSPWHNAQFDNLSVRPVAPTGTLRYLPLQELRALGASNFRHGYEPRKALDGSVQSMWHTNWDPRVVPPQSMTIDLGRARPVGLLTYQPRTDGNLNGAITRYTLETSVDGQNYTKVAEGTWPLNAVRKEITLDGTPARYLRLTGVEGAGDSGGYVSAAELQVAVLTQN